MNEIIEINDWNHRTSEFIRSGYGELIDIVMFVNGENYRAVSGRLKNMCGKYKNRLSSEEIVRLNEIVKAVHTKILDEISDKDKPSLIMLSKVFAEEGKWKIAERYVKQLNEVTDSGVDTFTLMMSIYEKQIREYYFANPHNSQIKNMQSRVENLYEQKLKELAENDEVFVLTSTHYARFEKQIKNYSQAISILNRAVRCNSSKMYRILKEKGMIYQARCPYFSLERSIECLKEAKELYEESNANYDYKEYLAILVPLATSLFMAGKYEECLKISELALTYSKHDNNVITLIKKSKSKLERVKAA